ARLDVRDRGLDRVVGDDLLDVRTPARRVVQHDLRDGIHAVRRDQRVHQDRDAVDDDELLRPPSRDTRADATVEEREAVHDDVTPLANSGTRSGYPEVTTDLGVTPA